MSSPKLFAKNVRPTAALAVLSVFAGSVAEAGLLSDFDVVIFTSLNANNHIHGTTLVGGNLTGNTLSEFGQDYDDGSSVVEYDAGRVVLKVGGNITGEHKLLAGVGEVQDDPGTALTVEPSATLKTGVSTDLTALLSDFVSLSGGLFAEPDSGLASDDPYESKKVNLVGTGSLLEVFTLTEGQFERSNLELHFSNIDPNAQVLINVQGVDLTRPTQTIGGGSLNSLQNRLLWNFGEAGSVSLGSDWYGSILAPNADLAHTNNSIYGDVYAKSASFGGEVHSKQFQYSPVPEPASLLFLGTIGVLSGLLLRRRR